MTEIATMAVRRHYSRFLAMSSCLRLICAVIFASCVVAGCSSGPSVAKATPTVTSTSTTLPSPVPTTIPAGSAPTPTDVPAGWQVYVGPHFSVAYPAGWTVSPNPQGDNSPSHPNVVYALAMPDGTGHVSIGETDNVDAATIQSDFCAGQATIVTLAGLPMRYQVNSGGVNRSWEFVTTQGTVYGLTTTDGNQSASSQAQDQAILATFTPEYTTPACH